MKTRTLLSLTILALALVSAPAWARPCCSDCPSYPDLDPQNDPCARVCLFSCFAAPGGTLPGDLAAGAFDRDAGIAALTAAPGETLPASSAAPALSFLSSPDLASTPACL